MLILATSVISMLPTLAETNALIEVKIFKDWVIQGEYTFGGFAFKNTGTDPLPLAKKATDFELYQLIGNKSYDAKNVEEMFQWIERRSDGFISLLPEETHVYAGRKFYLENEHLFFEGEVRFTVPIYFGNGVWIDTEPVILNGVVPDSIEHMATLADVNGSHNLVAVAYKNERWLYAKYNRSCFPICPISLNKVHVEPHDGKSLYKIWDGDKSMIYQKGTSMILEGPDENDVFGKWTRERRQQAEADNAEVRRKKQEVQ